MGAAVSTVVVGVVAGAVAGIILISHAPALPAKPLLILMGVAAFLFLWRGKPAAGCLAGLCLGAMVASLYGQLVMARTLSPACTHIAQRVAGQVSALPTVKESVFGGIQQRFILELSEPLPAACGAPRRLMLSYYGAATILPGEHWRFSVRLKQPRGHSNPALHDRQYWFVQAGIHAVGSVKGEGVRLNANHPGAQLHQRWRHRVSERVKTLPFAQDVRAVLAALTIADKSGINTALWQQFASLGVNHLLVISGLHVGLVAGLALLVARGLCAPLRQLPGIRRWAPAVLSISAAGLYMALADFSLPTQRAFTMLVCFLLATGLMRPQPAALGLLYAALILLLLNPLAALGSGFWLSFGAVAALLWLAAWRAGAPRWRQFVGTHGYMTLAMFPLGAYFFGGASVVSMLANAILIPLVGLVVVPLALIAALGHLLDSWLQWLPWLVAGTVLEAALAAMAAVTSVAGGGLFRVTAGGFLPAAMALMACLVLPVPLSWQLRLPTLVLLLPLLFVPARLHIGAAGGADYVSTEPVSTATRVSFLDVGQGTAVVVQAGNRALLYDTAGGVAGEYTLANAVVVPYLHRQGIAVLDTLIVSHQDADHSAGMGDVLGAFAVGRLRYGGDAGALHRGKPCVAGEAWRWPGGQVFQMLSPAHEPDLDSNNGSCVLRIQAGGRQVLLAGDIDGGRERLVARYWPDRVSSDVLLAAHHGSKTSSYWSFIKHVKPAFAVISAGYANRFGHPHPEVTARLQAADASVYATPHSGALTFEIEADGALTVVANRAVLRPYWM